MTPVDQEVGPGHVTVTEPEVGADYVTPTKPEVGPLASSWGHRVPS